MMTGDEIVKIARGYLPANPEKWSDDYFIVRLTLPKKSAMINPRIMYDLKTTIPADQDVEVLFLRQHNSKNEWRWILKAIDKAC